MADTTRGLRGLTFEGALSPATGEVSRLENIRRTGNPNFGRYTDEPSSRFRNSMMVTSDEERFLNDIINWSPSRNERMLIQQAGYMQSLPTEDIGFEAANAGYGSSRFDKRLTSPTQLNDIEDARSSYQSTFGVITNSLAKMGVLAGTTAADSWVGLPAGLINLSVEALSGNINSSRDALNAIISNPVSAKFQSINDKSEEIFRNYQPAEERQRPWWENIFTANFIGDTLIKNAGFTIGAVIGGKVAVNALAENMGMKEARNAFKGLAAELGIEGKTDSEILSKLAAGVGLEKRAAVKALEESAKKLKDAELGLRIAGGLVAGTGEARIEALNSVSELERMYNETYGDIDSERIKALEGVKEEMELLNIDINTPDGQKFYNEKKKEIDDKYIELKEQIAHDKALVANTVFALNVPLLTFGDMFQWGRLILDDYAVDRGLAKGIKQVAKNTVTKEASRAPGEVVSSIRYAAKGNKITDTLGKIGAGSRNVLIESQEEMNQSFFSEMAKAKAMGNTTEFMERLYDPMAVHDTVSWLDAAKEGMRQSWLNKDDWVEGFAGGFMGFMGLPSISVKVNENGQRKPKFTMEGGVWSPVREKNEEYERRNKIIETLNNKLESKDFLNYFYGKIGDRHFDVVKEDAIKEGDETLYEKADHAQFINNAIMFDKAGRLQDLVDIIDSFNNVTDDDIDRIKALFPDNKEIQGMSTNELKTIVSANVDKAKRRLNDYIKVSNDLRVTYGNTKSDSFIEEMTWQTVHLDEIEQIIDDTAFSVDTNNFISKYRQDNNIDESGHIRERYDIVSSKKYKDWLISKYNDKNDADKKSESAKAIKDADMASSAITERKKYIDRLSELSSDPEVINKRRENIFRDMQRMRSEAKVISVLKDLTTTGDLSKFISNMEDIDQYLHDDVLAKIKDEADNGNVMANEYITARNIDTSIKDHIEKVGKKTGATETEKKQALAAWNYFKYNSPTIYDLTKKHEPSEIDSTTASDKAVNLLNDAISSVIKTENLYKKIAQRPKSRRSETNNPGEERSSVSTKFNTTGNKLTKKRYFEIVKDLQEHESEGIKGPSIFRLNLELANMRFNDEPASGIVYLYYKNNKMYNKNNVAMPIVFDDFGNEISQEDVKALLGPNKEDITTWIKSSDFPLTNGALRNISVATDSLAKKYIAGVESKSGVIYRIPVVDAGVKGEKTDSASKETGKDPGSKTNPHKFIAPNMDMALIGSDGHAVAEVLRELKDDDEVRFGIESDDGPIYLLAGKSNSKIGTLPEPVDGVDAYSGLQELVSLIRDEYKSSKDRRNADNMWVSEKYVNHIREKRNTGFETIEDNIPLDEIPNFSNIKEPAIMFVYNEGGEQKQVFSVDGITMGDLQLKASLSSDNLPSGFAYLLVPSGKKGNKVKYIPVMLYTQNVNGNDGKVNLDLRDPAVTSKGFGKRVSDTIDKVVSAITKKDSSTKVSLFKAWALNTRNESKKDSLQRLLYFNTSGKSEVQFYIKETCPQHPDWFRDDDVLMVINRHTGKGDDAIDDYTPIVRGLQHDDGSEYTLRDQIIDTLYNLEYTTKSGESHYGPTANLDKVHFGDKDFLKEYIRELINSKMLLTDVKDFDLDMPSYVLDYWSESEGKFVRPSHTVVKKTTGKPTVTTKKSKSKGVEKIVDLNISGQDVKYNLTSNEVKVGTSKWFTSISSTKSQDAAVKKLGFNSVADFTRTVRALAVIADKYGDSEIGEDRIGDKVLLRKFIGNKDYGFIIVGDSGKFMTPKELTKFKTSLNGNKAAKKEERKAKEAKRVAEAKREEVSDDKADDDNEEEFMQEVGEAERSRANELSRMGTVRNVRQAIEHLRRNAPQYSGFLDYISKIGIYDDVVIEFANIIDANNRSVGGKNIMRFRGNEYTNRIVIGGNSYGYQTVMHELAHAFTSVALRYDSTLRDDVRTVMDYMRDTVGNNNLINALGTNGMYAFDNEYEFIAEFFSNPKLQELAKNTEIPVNDERSSNIFQRIIDFISRAIRSLIGRRSNTLYDKLDDTLRSIIDRQVELNEAGKIVFKTADDFAKSSSLSKGAAITDIAFAMRIPTIEQIGQHKIGLMDIYDRSENVRNLRKTNAGDTVVDAVIKSQLLNRDDNYSTYSGQKRLVSSDDVYEYNCGTSSSLFGVKVGDIFVTVKSVPIVSDRSYDTLIRSVSNSEMPVIIGSSKEDVDYYKRLGMIELDGTDIDGGHYVVNSAFTDGDLYSLGTTYSHFADVLDDNENFTRLRGESYSDKEWKRMSDYERYHARKCIGI